MRNDKGAGIGRATGIVGRWRWPIARLPLRRLLSTLVVAMAMLAAPAAARTRFAGVWVFDRAPSYPGVTMMQVAVRDGVPSGSVSTRWYGPIPMLHPRIHGDRLTFDLRNLNDRAHPTRRWTARATARGVTLAGAMWSSPVVQRGRHGTVRDAEARAFRFAPPPPPPGAIPPDGLAATPPMGWSSWNKFADRIDDRTVRAIADAMVSTGLRDAGYVYVNIDDGWQGTRGPDGRLRPNARFPDMKALADDLHAKGLKLGLYSSPGPRTCAGYEGSYGHVRQDAQTFADWGVDYLKYDLCSGEWFYDDADGVQRAYHEMGLALKATGRPIVYSLCEYGRFDVATWGRSVGGHLWRTTGDITDDYAQMAAIGFDRNPAFPHHGPGGWNDPDMLEIGNGGMSEDEYRTHMTLWAMQAAPLVMGHDVRRTGEMAKRLLENRAVIAIDQDALGVQGRRLRREGDIEIWRKELSGGAVALAYFNRGATPVAVRLQPADAGTGAATDLWRGTVVDPGASVMLPPHGVTLLKVAPRS